MEKIKTTWACDKCGQDGMVMSEIYNPKFHPKGWNILCLRCWEEEKSENERCLNCDRRMPGYPNCRNESGCPLDNEIIHIGNFLNSVASDLKRTGQIAHTIRNNWVNDPTRDFVYVDSNGTATEVDLQIQEIMNMIKELQEKVKRLELLNLQLSEENRKFIRKRMIQTGG
jgi:hypothetical protein